MINDTIKISESHMKKAIEAFKHELSKLRTGRANSSLIEHLKVDYYGTETPLNQVSSITVSDARTLMVTPWEKTMLKPIEKAIMSAELGLNPVTDGNVLRIPLPALTEERRKEMIKMVKNMTEHARVSIRNVRRDANNALKDLLKKKTVNEDAEKHAQNDIQKLTDKYITDIDAIAAIKEKDLMEV